VIPALLIAGFAIGFLPRPWAILGVALLAAGWAALLLANRTVDAADALGAVALGLANAATGALVGQATRAAIRVTRSG
jgi:hypothetical protein